MGQLLIQRVYYGDQNVADMGLVSSMTSFSSDTDMLVSIIYHKNTKHWDA